LIFHSVKREKIRKKLKNVRFASFQVMFSVLFNFFATSFLPQFLLATS